MLVRRAYLLKSGIVVSAAALAGLVIISSRIVPHYTDFIDSTTRRALPEFLCSFFGPASPYIAYATALAAVAYALAALVLLFYLFEKTQTVEAHFFMFFVFSFVFELLRTALPLRNELNLPVVYLSLSAHILIFFRYFGAFSIFCAGIYAAGFKTEREDNFIFPIFITTLFISFRIPINTWTWDTSLCLASGYPKTFHVLEITVAVGTVISFFCAAYKSGIKEYYITGMGALCVLIGRAFLLYGDTADVLVISLVLLAFGTWFISSNLRKIYLWS